MNILKKEAVNSWARAMVRVWFPGGSPKGINTSGRTCSRGGLAKFGCWWDMVWNEEEGEGC